MNYVEIYGIMLIIRKGCSNLKCIANVYLCQNDDTVNIGFIAASWAEPKKNFAHNRLNCIKRLLIYHEQNPCS